MLKTWRSSPRGGVADDHHAPGQKPVADDSPLTIVSPPVFNLDGDALEHQWGVVEVQTTLKKGGSVTITGFGTFTAPKRAARTGRNPRTGATIKIKAAKVPKFRPGKGLRDAL